MVLSIYSIKLYDKRSLVRINLIINQKLNVLHHMNNLFFILISTLRNIAVVFSHMFQMRSSKLDLVLLLKLIEVKIVVKGIVLT